MLQVSHRRAVEIFSLAICTGLFGFIRVGSREKFTLKTYWLAVKLNSLLDEVDMFHVDSPTVSIIPSL